MAATRVLLLGGHGKVSLHLTPLLLAKSWDVTSVIRNPDQEKEILQLGQGKPGKVNVLIESLDEVDSPASAQKVLDSVKPNIVIWSAGAGGKGGEKATFAVDRDAAKHYISSSLATPSIQKFLMVSFIGSRQGRPPWWSDEDYEASEHVKDKVLPAYAKAKIAADEHFAALANKRSKTDDSFQAINLRPGTLTDDPPSGKILLGKTGARGKISRADVAAVAVELLARNDTRGWYDLLQGDESINSAIDRLVKEGHDGIVGEDLDRINALV